VSSVVTTHLAPPAVKVLPARSGCGSAAAGAAKGIVKTTAIRTVRNGFGIMAILRRVSRDRDILYPAEWVTGAAQGFEFRSERMGTARS
jgi:hypothetical protein